MANVLKSEKQLDIMRLMVEGNSIRSIERFTGVHRDTICRLLVKIGEGCREFLDVRLRNLELRHVECDEIWTFVGKKQGKLDADKKRFIFDLRSAQTGSTPTRKRLTWLSRTTATTAKS